MKTTKTLAFLSLALSCASVAYADTFGSGLNTFDIEFVTIGNPGNPADADDGDTYLPGDQNLGAVDYGFRMGKYEISEIMIAKANAEGGLGITYYNFPGVDRPATDITWHEAARFVNWLNTSTGHAPAYKFDSGGNFQLWNSGEAGYNPNNLFRNSRAKYFLPSADEWYKAAYYDPVADVYYDYPTGSDTVPDGIDFVLDPSFDAVFWDGAANNDPNVITNVGVLSPYGTAGQGGNVWEWEESALDLVNNSTSEDRGYRGSDWCCGFYFSMQASARGFVDPAYGDGFIGFRVASVPEPSTLLLFCIGALGVAALRRRHGKR